MLTRDASEIDWVPCTRPIRNPKRPGIANRVFVPKDSGGLWPRISLVVYENSFVEHSITISCAVKTGGGAWWQDEPIPKQLIPELIEMLQEI